MLKQKLSLKFFFNLSRNYVSLAQSFNSCDYLNANRKYAKERLTGLFDIEDLKCDAGLEMIMYKAQSDCRILLKEALSPIRQRKIVQVLDDISDSICQVADLSECMRLLHPDKNMRELSAYVCQKMSHTVETFNTNKELFSVLDKVVKNDEDVLDLDEVDRRVGYLLHRDFEASGIHLNDSKREKFIEYSQKSVQAGADYHHIAESPVSIPAKFLSAELLKELNVKPDQNIEFSHPFSLSSDSLIRELGYRGYYSYNSKQEKGLQTLMECRYNMARHAGYNSFSQRANESMICETAEDVKCFINDLSMLLRPYSEYDRIQILSKKYKENISDKLCRKQYQLLPWDVQYFVNHMRQNSLPCGYEEYQPYLSLGACMEGINMLLDSHFSATLEVEEAVPGELWHPDVFKVAVHHRKEGRLGTIYCDLFGRDNKPLTDCHFTVRAGRDLQNGDYQLPIIVLHACLMPTGNGNGPALLSPTAVETLFHEWGHAIHSLFARTRYQHVAGTRCSTDLAEAPSTLMENFALHPQVLKEYARHHLTGSKIPEKLLVLNSQRYICSAIENQLTLTQSMFDQVIHGSELLLSDRKSSSVYNEIISNKSMVVGNSVFNLPEDADNLFWTHKFGHLLNYGARFYCYLMSNCLAGFIWRNGFSEDPWSSSVGEHYRKTVLQHGGQYKPMNLVSDFASKPDLTIKDLIEDYVEDVKSHYDKYM